MEKYSFSVQVPAMGHPDALPKILFTCIFSARSFADANELAAKLYETCLAYVIVALPKEIAYERSQTRQEE